MDKVFLAEVKRYLDLAQELFEVDLSNTVVFMDTKGLTAGWAQKQGNELTLKFNTEAIEKYFALMVADTIPHEVAHLVCFMKPHLGKGHNAGWKNVCMMLGGQPDRCHNMKLTSTRKTRSFEYLSENGDRMELSIIRHNRLQNGRVSAYVCAGIKYTKDEFIQELV